MADKKLSEENINEETEEVTSTPKAEKIVSISENDDSKKTRTEMKKEEKALRKRQRAISKKKGYEPERYEPELDKGLTKEQVSLRNDEKLVNITHSGSTKSVTKIVLKSVFTFFNILTILIAAWLISVGAWTDLFFIVIVTANTVIGIIQEIRAKNTIDKLSLVVAPTAVVLREGIKREINIKEIVLDDILILSSGKQICSDSIVVDGSIEVNESLLTGESDAIVKKPGDILYSGSYVISGNCKARVDKVGKDNYIETLTSQAKQYKKPKSDLLKSLNLIIKVMAFLVIVLGGSLFFTQLYMTQVDYITAVRKTAGAMIGMIPSGLYLLSSVALFVGVIKLAQNNVMVQDLYCIEMLARVNVLCLDKTGTITDGTMSVKTIVDYNVIGGIPSKKIVSAMLNALNEDNLTSKALDEKFGRAKRIKHLATIPFSSQRKFNAVTFEKLGTFALGAPEFIMKEHYQDIKKDVEANAKLGFRVLLLAHFNGDIKGEALPNEKPEVVSLILIEDNIRPDAINTIGYFKRSGVEVKVISGDNPLTVSKISERAGIANASECISLDGLTDDEVIEAATKYTVFGRVSPAQKKLLVKTLKAAGKTVAMTGDGVNDILALKEADCSIAVASGSEAARNVSHLVLLDSNFDSMPKVVAEGRRVINNVSGVACLFLTKTIFSVLLSIQAILSRGVYPISTNQLLLIDILVTGIPSAILVLEPNNREVVGKFIHNVLKGAIPGAVSILICASVAFWLIDSMGLDFMTSSTIIVILATHTSLMVLFKVCHPFNVLRRSLCATSYTLFILSIMFIPNFFEFRPLIPVSEYYSAKLVTETLEDIPTITISKENAYIIDGMVSDLYAENSNSGTTLGVDSNGYLRINNKQTDYKIHNPILSTKEDEIYGNGYKTNVGASTDYEIIVTQDGFIQIHVKGKDGNVTVNNTEYNIIPKTKLENGYLHIGDLVVQTDIQSVDDVGVVKVNSDYLLTINGEIFTYNNKGETTSVVLEVPVITESSDGYIILGAEPLESPTVPGEVLTLTKVGFSNLAELEASCDMRFVSDGVFIISTRTQPSTTHFANVTTLYPAVSKSEAGHYIINGRYTNTKARGSSGDNVTKLEFENIDGTNYLVINDVLTDEVVNVVTTTGGIVQHLSIPALLVLITLCLFTSPLMRMVQGFVPWLRQSRKFFQSILSKL